MAPAPCKPSVAGVNTNFRLMTHSLNSGLLHLSRCPSCLLHCACRGWDVKVNVACGMKLLSRYLHDRRDLPRADCMQVLPLGVVCKIKHPLKVTTVEVKQKRLPRLQKYSMSLCEELFCKSRHKTLVKT